MSIHSTSCVILILTVAYEYNVKYLAARGLPEPHNYPKWSATKFNSIISHPCLPLHHHRDEVLSPGAIITS